MLRLPRGPVGLLGAPAGRRAVLRQIDPALRRCSGSASKAAQPPPRKTLAERNDQWREASEAKLEESRKKLCAKPAPPRPRPPVPSPRRLTGHVRVLNRAQRG